MGVMDPGPELERVLRGLREAAEFAKTYRFEMTEEYLALIAPRSSSFSRSLTWTDPVSSRSVHRHESPQLVGPVLDNDDLRWFGLPPSPAGLDHQEPLAIG